MKKYFYAIAILVLVAGISAFSVSETHSKYAEASYWFLMDASGTQVTTNQVSDPSSLCPDTESADCARKYNESQTEIVSGIRQVKSGQVNAQIDFRGKE